ncbi:MAG: DNA repair protein RecO [Salinivirgaceae bacterium]|nr:DNA repair protein RecO [Salinivirgaceae bacterium]
MIISTSAIVLSYTKYSDASIIVNCLTEKLGRQSFLVYGIGGRKNNKLSLFQPLFIIDVQMYNKTNRSLQKAKEVKINPPLFNITSDIKKSTLVLFLAELISKSVNEEYSDENLFSFIKTSILILEEIEHGVGLFHIAFLLKMAKIIGILPELNHNHSYIDLKDGSTLMSKPPHHFFISAQQIKVWETIADTPYESLAKLSISKAEKEILLNSIVQLYELHILNFNTLKSYAILKEVYS